MKKQMIILFSTFLFTFSALAVQPLLFVTEHSPPFQFQTASGDVEGFTTEVIQAALKLTPYQYQIKIYPWSRSFNLAKAKENTCIYLMSRDKEREPHFQWVAPIISTNDYFVGLAARTDITVNSIDDVKKYKVAVLKEDRTYYELLKRGFVPNKNLYVINNSSSLLSFLTLRPEIDFVLSDTINVKYRAKFSNIDDKLFKTYLKLNDAPIDLYLACSLQTPKDVVQELNQAINIIKNNGTYDKIVARWR